LQPNPKFYPASRQELVPGVCSLAFLPGILSRPSTFVENPLQIDLFMQNKPNFRKSQMNLTPYKSTAYENKSNWTLGQSKPNSNPIKPNLRKAKMNINLTITKDYRKKDDFLVRINKPNLVRRRRIPKMNINIFATKDYENEPPFGPKKQTQNKPNLVRRRRIPKMNLKSLAKKSGHTRVQRPELQGFPLTEHD